MNYETSRTVRRIKLPQGIIRRMSVSVLLDHKMRWESAKAKGGAPQKIVEPVSPEEIKVIHDVVAAAAGFNSTRGDQLTVDSLPFEATLRAQPPDWMAPAPATPKAAPVLWKQPVVLAGGGVVLLVLLGAGLLIATSRRKARAAMAELQKQLEAAQSAPPLVSEAAVETAPHPLAVSAPQDGFLKQMPEAREPFRLPPLTTTKTEVLTRQVIEEARKDPAALAQIIRSWLNEKAESAPIRD
jgi:flagellar M-ring protein FliF